MRSQRRPSIRMTAEGALTQQELSEKQYLSLLSGLPLRLYVNSFNKLVSVLVIAKNVGGSWSQNARGGVAAALQRRVAKTNTHRYQVNLLRMRRACLHWITCAEVNVASRYHAYNCLNTILRKYIDNHIFNQCRLWKSLCVSPQNLQS